MNLYVITILVISLLICCLGKFLVDTSIKDTLDNCELYDGEQCRFKDNHICDIENCKIKNKYL